MKEVKKQLDLSYTEYEPGDLVCSSRHQGSIMLDYQRIYQVKSFTAPDDIIKYPFGQVQLKNRLSPVTAEFLMLATEENIRNNPQFKPEEVDYFIKYLKWLSEDDRFGND